MRRVRVVAVAAAIAAAFAAPASPQTSVSSALQILGSVTNAAGPVANALVVALNLSSFDTTQTFSSADGTFSLPSLQAGIYKIIAVKNGFAPAIATIMPTGKAHKVTLRLGSEGRSKTRDDEIWEVRGSLPGDVLREIDQILEPVNAKQSSYDIPRFKGQMVSMTGMAAAKQADGPAFAQTGLGVQSRIGDNWQMAIRGDMQRFDDPTDNQTFGAPVAQSSAMSMELRSSPTESVRYVTTRSMWRYADGEDSALQAGVRSDNLEWQHGDARVKVRYFAHDNVFQSAVGSDLVEVAGDTTLLQTRRNDFGVSLRVRQESVRTTMTDTLRTADVDANGTVALVPSFIVHYGMSSRLGLERTEWAPSTGVEWKITKNTAVIGSGSYKVLDNSTDARLVPTFVSWSSDDGQVLPRYSYSFGIVSNRDESNQISAIMTMSAADEPLRIIISDGTQQFWDSVLVDSGDTRRDLRVAYRHDFGPRFAVDIATTAGTATPRDYAHSMQKVYVSGDLQTIFTPTRTTLAVSYRDIDVPQVKGGDYHSSRMNVRMAQSLYLPIDVKLLIGFELVHAQNSPYLLDTLLPEQTAKKYIGGLAVNF